MDGVSGIRRVIMSWGGGPERSVIAIMRVIVSVGVIIILGAVGYSLGEYLGGQSGMQLGAIAGVAFGVLLMAALNTKAL